MGHLRVTIGYIRRATVGHLMATDGHFRVTIGCYFSATVGQLRVGISQQESLYYRSPYFLFFTLSELKANTTELHHITK